LGLGSKLTLHGESKKDEAKKDRFPSLTKNRRGNRTERLAGGNDPFRKGASNQQELGPIGDDGGSKPISAFFPKEV